MENNYYSKETYFNLKKECRNALILSIASFSFGLLFLGLSAFLINVNTVLLIKFIDSFVVSLSFVLGCYLFIEHYLPKKNRNRFLYRLLTVDRFEGKIQIKNIREPYLIKKNINAYEIEAIDDDGKILNCFYESLLPIEFEIGDTLIVTLASNFIVDIKEKISHE